MNTPQHLGKRAQPGALSVPAASRGLGAAVAGMARAVARGIGGNPAQLRLSRVLRSLAASAEVDDTIQRIPHADIPMLRPTRIVRVDAFTPTAAAQQIAAQAQANDIPLVWPQSCLVVGVSFGCVEGTQVALSQLGVRIQVEGAYDLFTNGKAGTFINAGLLMGSPAVAGSGFWPCIRWVDQGTPWDLTARNEGLAGAIAITPTIAFHIVDPRDLEEISIATSARDAG